jgi:site-specific DNA-adenine methylase
MSQELGQHEFIDTTAKWGRDFVEVINPLEENSIMRFYFEPPQQPEMAQFNFQEYGPDNWGDSQVTKPEFVAEQKATNEALRTMVDSQREWQGLTEEDIKDIEGWVEFKEAGSNERVPLGKLAFYISHKIREKNV